MKKLILALALLLAFPASAIDTGTADQVYVIPHTGGRAKFGKVDLSQTAAAKFGSSTGVVKTSGGTLSAATIVDADVNSSAAIARSKIGTGTAHQAVTNDSSGNFTGVSPGTNRNLFMSNGTDWASTAMTAPTVTTYNLTTQTGWELYTNAGNATLGATYTNNSNTYTVLNTVSGGGFLFLSGAGALSGNTLTKASGTGDATITVLGGTNQIKIGTYTTPTNPSPLYLHVRALGAGGGGAGSSTTAASNGGAGSTSTDTIFGVAVSTGAAIDAGSGSGAPGQGSTAGGNGGSAGINTSGTILQLVLANGSDGDPGWQSNGTAILGIGGCGAPSVFGGRRCGGPNVAGPSVNGTAYLGSSGGGAGFSGANMFAGGSGGAGAYVEAVFTSPASTYYYSVGPSANGGGAGTSGGAGGASAAGLLIIEAAYQ